MPVFRTRLARNAQCNTMSHLTAADSYLETRLQDSISAYLAASSLLTVRVLGTDLIGLRENVANCSRFPGRYAYLDLEAKTVLIM